jgi:DNA-binding MarR family transcriptional regulator
MSELAEYTLSSRSRLTHQIDRMVRDGLVERNACSNDKRGFFATMTEAGWQKLVAAAPDHVESVRQHLVDVLSPQQFAALGTISLSVLESLDPALQEKVVRSVQ